MPAVSGREMRLARLTVRALADCAASRAERTIKVLAKLATAKAGAVPYASESTLGSWCFGSDVSTRLGARSRHGSYILQSPPTH